MVHASVRLLIPPGTRDEVLGILSVLAQRTRFDRGCIRCHVYRDEEEEEGVLLDELWSDEESLNDHLRSSGFRNVLLVSELSTAPPEFRFETVLNQSGIETIENARSIPAAPG